MNEIIAPFWGWLIGWVGLFGGLGAVTLLVLGWLRWRTERRLREREVAALERQARAMEERNRLMKIQDK